MKSAAKQNPIHRMALGVAALFPIYLNRRTNSELNHLQLKDLDGINP